MQRLLHDMFQERLAPMAAFECGPFDDLVEVRSQLRLMFDCLADLGEGCRVSGAVDFSGHPRLPVETRISHAPESHASQAPRRWPFRHGARIPDGGFDPAPQKTYLSANCIC